MNMKSVSIPEDLYAYLYANINADRKSLYAVIEWLRDCKEHSDRTVVSDDKFRRTFNIVMQWVGKTPETGDYVGLSQDPGKIQITNKTKAIGFVIPPIDGLKDHEVCIAVDLDKLSMQVNNAENCY